MFTKKWIVQENKSQMTIFVSDNLRYCGKNILQCTEEASELIPCGVNVMRTACASFLCVSVAANIL